MLNNLLPYLKIIAVDEDIIKKSLKSKHKDFEDAIQMLCANAISSMDYIATRNVKGFKFADIPVYAPDELLEIINKSFTKSKS